MIHHLGGTVKNGVIMPDFPVPDNTYVEIVVPNATREILNRVRRKAMNPAGEQTIVSERKGVHLVMESDVPEFLRYNDAENGFDNRLDLIISFFPEVYAFIVTLEEERYDPGSIRVWIRVLLPDGHSRDLLEEQQRSFWQCLGERASNQMDHLFFDDIDLRG